MRAAVLSGSHVGRQGRTTHLRERLCQPLVFPIKGAVLPTDAPHFASPSRRVPTDGHSGASSLAGPEEGYFGAERILVAIVGWVQFIGQTAHAQAGNFRKTLSADTQMV